MRCSISTVVTATFVLLAAGSANAQDEPPPPPVVEGPPPPPVESPPPSPSPSPSPSPPPPPPLPPSPSSSGPHFGDAGVFVITADSGIAIGSTEYSQSAARVFSVTVSHGLDYFVTRHFSIGADAGVSYGTSRGYGADSSLVEETVTSFAGAARLGVDLPLSDTVSFYPRLSLGIESVHRASTLVAGSSLSVAANPVGAPTETQVGPYVNVFAPFLLHAAPHFFVGLGPAIFHEFGKANTDPNVGGERTTIQARMVVGGWWGGDDAPTSDATATATVTTPAERPGPRFGDRDVWVLSGELGAAAAYSTYAGVDSSSTSISISPSFDYFVATHVSLGLGGYVSYGSVQAPRPDGPKVKDQVTTLSLVGRIGVDLPLSRAFSFYPRASISVGRRSYDETSGTDENMYAVLNVTPSLYAPLLVHFAPHAFVGFGPYVSHDLANAEENSSRPDNLSTTVGARLIVGGWL